MGHIVNPVSHRLGASKCWNSVWPNNLSFSFSYSLLMKADWDIFLFFKRFFDLKILVQSGYIFSHVKVIREGEKIFCVVYFYDGSSLERSDNLKQILLSKACQLFNIETMFFIALYSFLKLYQWNSAYTKLIRNFKFDLLFNYFIKKKRLLQLKSYLRNNLARKINFAIYLFLDFSLVMIISTESLHCYFLTNYIFNCTFLDIIKSMLFNFSSLLKLSFLAKCAENFLKNNLINLFTNVHFNLKRDCYLLQRLKIFFYREVSDLFIMLRWRMFKRISAVSKMLRCGFQFLSFNRYFLYYFGDNFFLYFRVKSRLLNSIKHTFRNLPSNKVNAKTKIILKKLEVSNLNATIMSKYIAIRLRQRFQLKEALMPMLRHLSNNEFVKGFRIVCAGRFTRKEIALYDLRTYSSVPFSGVSSKLDFSLSEVVLKYSICGIKVWLHKYCLPEREYSIEAIGMNFMLPPPVTETFSENLEFMESIKINPFRFESLQKTYSYLLPRKGNNSRDFKKSIIRFSTRLGPTYDFFFFDYSNLPKGKKIKPKFSSFKNAFLS